MLAGRNMSVTLHDTDGQDHRPRTAAGGSGGGEAGGSIAYSSSSGAGSRRYSFGSAPAIGGKSRSTYNYTFGRIIGAQPETLEFRVLERTGEPTRLPFRLENLRVPEPRQGGLLD
jgi:hypothetical protein